MRILNLSRIFLILISFTGYLVHAQSPSGVHKDLDFNIKIVNSDSISNNNKILFDLIIQVDVREIPEAERLYIQIIDKKTEENAFTKTINKEVIQGGLTNSDKALSDIRVDSDQISFNIGPIEQGEYDVLLIIKNSNGDRYYGRKEIII